MSNARADGHDAARGNSPARRRRRWLLGLEPVFEGGWLHKGARARKWDVEPELVALSLLGDVTVDLAGARSVPTEVSVRAYAIFRDVDVVVAKVTHVELSGRANNGHLNNDVTTVPEDQRDRIIRIHGHTFLGDVTARATDSGQ